MPALTGEGVQARLVQSPKSIFPPARFLMVSLLSHGRYRPWLAGCAVAVMGFIVSYWAVLQQRESLGIIEQTRFTHEAKAFTDALGQRVAANTEIVFGLHSLFSLNPSLGRADFDRVVTELDAARRYPGVRNLAFTKRVSREDKAAYEESVRNDPSLAPAHRASFAIRPAGERDEYFVVHYIWPMRSDAEMLGLDISAQPANLASMHFSRDSGRPVASAPFDLIQERDHRTGFVIRIPVFGAPQPGNAAQRPFLGAVAVTLRVYDMVRALQSQGYLQGLSVAIEDAGSVRVPAQEGTSRSLLEHTAEVLAGARPLTRELEVHSRPWRLTFLPTQSLLSPSEQRLPWVAGAAGGHRFCAARVADRHAGAPAHHRLGPGQSLGPCPPPKRGAFSRLVQPGRRGCGPSRFPHRDHPAHQPAVLRHHWILARRA